MVFLKEIKPCIKRKYLGVCCSTLTSRRFGKPYVNESETVGRLFICSTTNLYAMVFCVSKRFGIQN